MRNQAVTKEAMDRYLNVVQGVDQTRTINNLSARNIALQNFARNDREALTEREKWAAAEKAIYEARLATMEASRDKEMEWVAVLKTHHREKDQIIINMLTTSLSIDQAAETVAFIQAKDDQLKLQCDLIDTYQAKLNSGTLQMDEHTKKYRADLSDEATKHRAEITKLYDRIAALVDGDGDMRNQLRAAAIQIAMHVASIAAKDAGAAAAMAAAMAAKDAEAAIATAAVTTAKDAEIARLKEELAAFSGGAMET
jgi:hypothetical protein